jgi:hypothetical protein
MRNCGALPKEPDVPNVAVAALFAFDHLLALKTSPSGKSLLSVRQVRTSAPHREARLYSTARRR